MTLTSLFSVVYDETVVADQLNTDLKVITDWAYQWKMDTLTETSTMSRLFFSQKRTKPIHPPLFSKDAKVVIKDEQNTLE